MNDLVIRADADTAMGTGHVMRCLALAQAWHARGGQVTMAGHVESEALRQRLEGTPGVRYLTLDRKHPDPGDVRDTLEIARQSDAVWLVLDGYHFDPGYHRRVRDAGFSLMVIDDYAHLPRYRASILLNQNIHAAQLAYERDPDTVLLLGTRYALLREEFITEPRGPREVRDHAGRVLVSLGGGDPENATLLVVRALQGMQITPLELEVRVVVGPANPHGDLLRKAAAEAGDRVQILAGGAPMPELMAWCDVAVTGGGSTCWELAYLGVPMAVLVLAENQEGVARGLEAAGAAVNLGWYGQLSEGGLRESLTALATNRDRRRSMSLAARQLVDGQGARRVVDAILGQSAQQGEGPLIVRPAVLADAGKLLDLANDPVTRGHSFSQGRISMPQHMEWLRSKLAAPGTRIWILELDGEMVGQVRYDRVDHATAEIDFAITSAFRGRGFGTKALAMTGGRARRELGVACLRGTVFKSNEASARAFAKAGFLNVARATVKGHDCLVFEQVEKGDSA